MHSRTHVVCGLGEVGAAIKSILSSGDCNLVTGVDPNKDCHADGLGTAEFLHICFPWSDDFKREADAYIAHFDPEVVIVHSSVPVGTTRSLYGGDAVHSPIEGLHPHLERSIRTFRKHFGGPNAFRAAEVFSDLGVPVAVHSQPETTEVAKLLSTSWYGMALLIAQEQAQMCRKYGVSYKEAVIGYTQDYNALYGLLDHPEYTRPLLTPPGAGIRIGGHCIAPNAILLEPGQDEPLHRYLASYNDGKR